MEQPSSPQTAMFELTVRVQTRDFRLRFGSAAGWIALLITAAIRAYLYLVKGVR